MNFKGEQSEVNDRKKEGLTGDRWALPYGGQEPEKDVSVRWRSPKLAAGEAAVEAAAAPRLSPQRSLLFAAAWRTPAAGAEGAFPVDAGIEQRVGGGRGGREAMGLDVNPWPACPEGRQAPAPVADVV